MRDNQPINPAAAVPAESAAAQPAAQSPQERLREITAGIEQGIQNLFQSERYAQYLRTMSHFHHYSLNNTMLIYLQKPDATLVAGYDKWKNQFERHVNRGEKGIKIIAPVPYTVKQTREKRDPQTRAVLLDASGQAQTKEVEVRLTHYRVVPVFDVSQTDGKPLPTIVNDLQGNVEHFDAFMEAVFRTSPVPIEITSIDNGADGFFSPSQQQINIREGMSEVQTVSAVIHEMAHAKLHDYNRRQQEATDIVDAKPKDRHTEEVEAESVSYAVCQYYGIETGENSFGYIAEWSKGRDLPELRSSLEIINRTASKLITDIDRHLKEIMHERGLDQEQDAPAAVQDMPTLETIGVQPAYALMPDPPVVRFYHPEHDGDELPVGPSTARILFDQGVPVYSYDRSAEGDRLVRDRKLLEGTPALYAVHREDWLQSPHHAEMLADLRSVQRTMEAALQSSPVDAFLIYQMRDDAGDGGLRFSNLADILVQLKGDAQSWRQTLADAAAYYQQHNQYLANLLTHTTGYDSFMMNITAIHQRILLKTLERLSAPAPLDESIQIYSRIYCYGTVLFSCDWILGKYSLTEQELADIYENALPEQLARYIRNHE